MSGIEWRGHGVQPPASAPARVPTRADAPSDLASRLSRALVRTEGGDPEEAGRALVELGRLRREAQLASLAAASAGQAARNPAEWLRDRLAEAFPPDSERRLRLGEAVVRHQGADPRSMTRAALEAAIASSLSALGRGPAPRPVPVPPRDELLRLPSLGPFAAPPPRPGAAGVAGLEPEPPAFSIPPLEAGVSGPREFKIIDVTIPVVTPSSVPRRKKKKGFFGKLLSVVSAVLTVLQFIPALAPFAMIMKMAQMAISAYMAIKSKNPLALLGAVASAAGAAGAQFLGRAAGISSQVMSRVAGLAGTVAKALQAYQAMRRGDWLGALAGLGAAVSGLAQSASGSMAEGLRSFAHKMQEVSGRLSKAVEIVSAARRGDFVGAVGLGVALSGDLKLVEEAAQKQLQQLAGMAERLGAVRMAIRTGDYIGAAARVAQIAGRLSEGEDRRRFQALEILLGRAGAVQRLVKDRDYVRAAQVLAEVVKGEAVRPETRAQMLEAARQLQQVAQALAQGRAGDWVGAGAQLARLASSFEWDNETRGRLLRGGLALRRGVGLYRSLRSGRYADAAEQLSDALSVLTDEALPLPLVVTRLEEAARLHQAIQHGDGARAALLLREVLERAAASTAPEESPQPPPPPPYEPSPEAPPPAR